MSTEHPVKNYSKISPYQSNVVFFILLVILPCTAVATEWPEWQWVVDNQQAMLSFANGDSVVLDGINPDQILNLRDGGRWAADPMVPGMTSGIPPHAAVLTPNFPGMVIPGQTMLELDLSNKTITPDTTFGIGDLPDFELQLMLLDSNDNPLPLTDLRSDHFSVTYPNNLIADKNVVIDDATGTLTLGPIETGIYQESGLSLFTNIPQNTAKLRIVTTTEIQAGDFLQFFFGEGELAPPGGGSDPVPEQPRVEGATLILPVVEAIGTAYYVELVIEPGTEPPIIVITQAQQLQEWDSTNASFFEDGILTIVNVAFGGARWWGKFQLIEEDPFRFLLLAADIDDDDDDNDGIPDSADDQAYIPADADLDPAGIGGSWSLTFEIVTPAIELQGTACEFDPRISNKDATFDYEYFTDSYTITTELFSLPLSVVGSSLAYSGAYNEEGGLTDSTVTMTLQTENSLSGSETWTWTAAGSVSCTDVQSTISGTR